MFDRLAIALADRSRRQLLTELTKRDPDDAIRPLAVVDAEGDGNENAETLRAALVHVHLPMLDEAGFVSWQPNGDRVTRGPRFEDVSPMLERAVEHADDLAAD